MNRTAIAVCLLVLTLTPTIQADEPPPTPTNATILEANPPIQLSLTALQLRSLLEPHCPQPTIEAEAQTQGFLLDITRKAARHAFDDEQRTARWLTDLLIEAGDRHLITITPDLAERFAAWLARGIALTLQPDLTVDELVQWIADGAELTDDPRPIVEDI